MRAKYASNAARYVPALTGIRALAALLVLGMHTEQNVPFGLDSLLPFFARGYLGVDFFFVLSGFILAYVHTGQTERDGCDVKATTFWRLRLARIAPAYLLGLLMTLPLLTVFLQDAAIPAGERIAGPILVVLFLQAWWPPVAAIWNFPAWSVSVELLFYALFPWLSGLSTRLSRPSLLVAAYCLVIASTACRAEFLSLPGHIPDERPDLQFQAFFPLLHLPHFIFGMALGRQYLFGVALASRGFDRRRAARWQSPVP